MIRRNGRKYLPIDTA